MGKKKQKEKRKQKQKQKKELEFRKWSELPELVLYYVFCRLLSVADVLCFSSVCRSWRRSVVSSSSCNIFSSSSSSIPPFIHFSILTSTPEDDLDFHTSYMAATCRLQETLTLGRRRRLLLPPEFPPKTVTQLPFLGYSNEHLIFYSLSSSSSRSRSLLLANVFTGQLTRVPYPIHGTAARSFRIALLTTTLLIVASDSIILYRRPNTDSSSSWHRLDSHTGASSLVLFQNKIFCVDPASERLIHITAATDDVDTGGRRLITETALDHLPPLPDHAARLCRHFGYRLADCGGERLLLLRFTQRLDTLHLPPPFWRTVDVFTLRQDSTAAWEEVDSLGDWCVFADAVGSCATACPEPARWGGRGNCVYLADPDPSRDGWLAVPLDGHRRQFVIYRDRFRSGGDSNRRWLTRWPSPVWVVPTKLHHHH